MGRLSEWSNTKMKSKKVNEPWEHFLFENVLDKNEFNLLLNYSELDSDYSNIDGLKRKSVDNRVFLNDKFVDENPQFRSLMESINDRKMWEDVFDVDLSNCYLRPELVDDRYPFELEVHTDLDEKLLSILLYIDKDDEQNLATDLYSDETTLHTKLDWKPNGGVGWKNSNKIKRWHAFTPEEFKGKRRILIINWCDKDTWNDYSQLDIGYKWYDGEYFHNIENWNIDPILHDRFANQMDREVGIHYETPIDGTFTLYWPNGVKRYEWNYKDGKRTDGKSLSWWPNGKLKIVRNWKDNEHYGTQLEFYTDGTLWLEEDQNTGTFVEYGKDGNIIQTGSFNTDYMYTDSYGARLTQPYWDDNWDEMFDEDSNTTK